MRLWASSFVLSLEYASLRDYAKPIAGNHMTSAHHALMVDDPTESS